MAATLTTLASFNGLDGGNPEDSLITDRAGDLFGTAESGGGADASGSGTVFEIAKSGSGYGALTALVSFQGSNFNSDDGAFPTGGLVADAAGDLFGTTTAGGSYPANQGTVFEIPKTGSGYGPQTILAAFDGSNGQFPRGTPLIDAAGDLFGTTPDGGAFDLGTVFEIPNTGSGYGAPVTLSSFNNHDSNPTGGLIADAAGDLFGTSQSGGAFGVGVVFEIPSTGSGGYGALTTLGSLTGSPSSGALTTDAAGDLFGTTQDGGASGNGTVFEVPSTGSGGYGALTTLASFNGGNGGAFPFGALIADAAGDLFGTTNRGGAGSDDGTVFEMTKTGSGYGAPTTLWSFSGGDGAFPFGGLNFDAAGNLFGTTSGGGGGSAPGTVFEITGSGFSIANVVAGATATFTGGGSAVALDSGLTVTDVASPTLASATVSIGSGFLAGDTLSFTNDGSTEGNIAVTSNVGGTLVLGSAGGTATLAQWQAALDSITYSFSPSDGDPTAGGTQTSRTIDWTVNDGTVSATDASTLNTVHAAPTITATGATPSFTGGGSAVTLDSSGITLTVPDSGGNLSKATVSIGSGFIAGDTLNFTNTASITGSYDAAHGVLTLSSSASASAAAFQAALESITYSFDPANGDPTGGGLFTRRTIDWVVNDGVANSTQATSTLDTVHVAPTVTAGGSASFTGGGSAVTLDGGIVLTAPDSGGTLSSATISIASGFVSGDTLSFVNTSSATFGNIAVGNIVNGTLTPSPAGATLTLSSAGGTATQAQWQNALASITYSFTPGGDPTGGGTHTSRTIDWMVNDGVANSPQVTSTLTTNHTPPTVTAGATASFSGGGPPVTADAGLAIVAPDSAGQLTSASVTILSGFTAGDTLSFTNQNGITGSYNPTTGVLALSGTASVAAYLAELQSVTYGFNPANGDPTAGGPHASRTLDWVVGDGVDFSNDALSTLNVGHVAPSVAAGPSLKYRVGDPPAVLGGGFAVSDPDSGGTLTGATVQITGGTFAGDGDVLSASTAGTNIHASYNAATETLTLSGTDTLANYQSVLDGTTFASGANPTNGGSDPSRTVTWTLNDGNSANGASTPVTSQILLGDFNTALVQAPDGTVDFLAFQGTSLIQSDSLFSSWSIKAEGDFSHDGQADRVSQDPTTGQIDLLFVNNQGGLQQSELLQGNYGKVVGAGDFDGSGRTGIATQDTQTGQVDLLWFTGTQLTGSELLAQPLPSIVGAADFSGDGKTDLVGQTANGQLDFLFFTGTQLTGSALTPQSYWAVNDVSNYGAVGNSEMISQDPVSGQLDYLKFNGTSIVSTDLMQQGGISPLLSVVPGSALAANLFNVA